MKYSCYYITCFGCLMGLFLHFYINFGTNLLTGGPTQIAVFAYFSVSQKRNIKRSPNGIKPSRRDFLNKRDPGDLEWASRNNRGGHEAGGAYPPGRAPRPRGPLVAPSTYFFLLYKSTYPANIQEHHENLIPTPQPSVPKRSHLRAFFGAPPEGALITEGLYINSMASPVMCE